MDSPQLEDDAQEKVRPGFKYASLLPLPRLCCSNLLLFSGQVHENNVKCSLGPGQAFLLETTAVIVASLSQTRSIILKLLWAPKVAFLSFYLVRFH